MHTIIHHTNIFEEYVTNITIEESCIKCSRQLDNKLVRLYVELDGTMLDMIEKAERVSKLDNLMFTMLSGIRREDEQLVEVVLDSID